MKADCLTTLFLLMPLTLFANPGDSSNVSDEAWESYLSGNFAHVEQLVMDAISDNNVSPEQLAKLYLTLGCADAMRGRDATAITSFEMALINDPTLDPSSLDLPPPVWNLFKPIRDRMPRYIDSERELLTVDSIEVMKAVYRNRSDVLRSFAFPGWGHLSENRNRGLLYIGIETAALTGLLISAVNSARAGDEYHSARDTVVIADKYDTYNLYYQLTWGFIFLSTANYLVAQIDYFSTPPILFSYNMEKFHYKVGISFKL